MDGFEIIFGILIVLGIGVFIYEYIQKTQKKEKRQRLKGEEPKEYVMLNGILTDVKDLEKDPITTRQRNFENKIRQLKTEERLARVNGDLKYAKKLRLEWRRLTLEYEIYSLENGRPYSPERTRLSYKNKGVK